MQPLLQDFYFNHDVCYIAKGLIGKVLQTSFNNQITTGTIVETEAYAGIVDKASHAFGGRRTARTSVMYLPGGHVYVYLCYGIHQMLNIVTNVEGVPHAVLIRAVAPIEGINIMLERRKLSKFDYTLTKGPGNSAKAMGISLLHSGIKIGSNGIQIMDDPNCTINEAAIITTARIGVAYAKEDALLPYRFYLAGNAYVSGKKTDNKPWYLG